MATKRKTKKPDPIIPQTKLLRLFQIISVLKAGRWTIKAIAERYDTSERTVYRYIKLLEEVDFIIDKDFNGCYFIHSAEDEPGTSQFTLEEMKLIKKLIQTELDQNPLRSTLLKKLSLNSEIDNVPRVIIKARLGKLVERLSQAIHHKKQVVLKDYHSANSNEVADRLIEPIAFGDNYQTVEAFDTKDNVCKQFKIDRIGEVIELDKPFAHEALHKKSTADMFGMTGDTSTWITLKLKMRAFLLLREEFPLSIPYCEKRDDGEYVFYGPVTNFRGIGRFVMGLWDEVDVVAPADFKSYVKAKMK